MQFRAGLLLFVVFVFGIAGLVVLEFSRLRSLRQAPGAAVQKSDAPEYDCVEDRPAKPAPASPSGLVDVTREVGLDFTPAVGPLGTYFMPESTGAGAAFLDYDNDGRLDVYFVNCGRSPGTSDDFPSDIRSENRLFRQTESGTFVETTAESGLGDTGYGGGVAAGDIDNDGLPDVYVANYGQDRLFRNNGNGTFQDITDSAGITNTDWATCAAMFDFDRDGWLDIMVVNYTADPTYSHSVSCGFQHGMVSYCGPHKFRPTIDRLYRNLGAESTAGDPSAVRFQDVTAESGLDQADTYGFGVICADLTGDGWPDIFVANDGAANRLWINQKDGTFREEAVARGAAFNGYGLAEGGMGVALGDVNGDLFPDIVVSHLTKETATFYQNSGSGLFLDKTEGSGIDKASMKHTGWGIALVDLNHDGLLDLPIVNGLVIPCHSGFPFHGEDTFQVRTDTIRDAAEYWKAYADENVLLMGRGNEVFEADDQRGGDFCRTLASGRGLVCGDFDQDGDTDLLVTNCGTAAKLYRNDLISEGNWLTVRPILESGREAIGAVVVIRAEGTSRMQVLAPQTSYLASHDPRLNFGLGSVKTVDEIIVYWPDGPPESSGEVFPCGPVNRFVTVRRGEGQPVSESE